MVEKMCFNCRYAEKSLTEEPCNQCYDSFPNWKSGRVEMVRICSTCHYEALSREKEPCHSCLFDLGDYVFWQSKQTITFENDPMINRLPDKWVTCSFTIIGGWEWKKTA